MTVETIKEGKFIIFNSPELYLSGYGYTKTEAARMFIESFKYSFAAFLPMF